MSEMRRDLPAREAPRETAGIELVAVDLDGTLLDDSKRVSEPTVEALRCLPERGVRLVIASARPPRSVRPIYAQLGLETWQINYNGALIWDEPSRRVVFHRPLAGSLVRELIDLCRDMFEEVLVSCEILDRWYTDRFDESFARAAPAGRMLRPDVIAPIETFCDGAITKLMLVGEPRIIARLEPLLLEAAGESVTIVQTEEEMLQVTHRRVSKAAALRQVAGHYGVPMERVMAIGDAPNDAGMLQVAGVGVAMDNAHRHVKEIADWVAPSNNDHGVYAALRRYGVCE